MAKQKGRLPTITGGKKTGLERLPRLDYQERMRLRLSLLKGAKHRLPVPPAPSLTAPQPTGKPPYPFNSWWEVWLDGWLRSIDYRWQTQVTFGHAGQTGSTRADWVNTALRVALYLDGPVHFFRHKAAEDEFVRNAVLAAGYRVVSWAPTTLAELQSRVREWYIRDIGN